MNPRILDPARVYKDGKQAETSIERAREMLFAQGQGHMRADIGHLHVH
jgi:hypothetical protein